ncbi:MAG: phosphatase PAP2 family protein [Metallibacterium scheffleri]|jgi:membrane-associated phospholipid phosphatase|uniref:phosphatase PAP2 family protein n=1 Tax=Metallibacterium scheffleri TaxID=993689 RepID=UPI0026EA2F47|nr:phosphatase PAP2 family protein [Metallibacterium scheffleri]MCK9366228.1 phosphatase PAP2 family protein [Metallibacterium scheffleri]
MSTPPPSIASATPPAARADFPAPQALLGACALALLAVLLCYFLLDRPLAWFVHDHDLRRYAWLEWLTHIPDFIVYASALVLLLTPFRLAWRKAAARGERVLLTMSLSVAAAVFLKNVLKYLFGRAWPETWIDHNPSLIQNHVYGFFWLQSGEGFHSFPSGHTTIVFAAMSVLWLAAPRLRWLAALLCAAVIVGLLGMDYHFLGDIVAGAFLAGVCGLYLQRALLAQRT